jgi:hypothetical protein
MATERTDNVWYRVAIWTAVVSGVFFAVVAALLIANYWTIGWGDPLAAPELARMKDRLLEEPRNEDLKAAYRERDLELRSLYFRGQAFSQRGVYLLFGGFVVFIVAVRYAVYCRRTDPVPHAERATAEDQEREARWARWAVTLFALVVAGALAAWAAMEAVEVDEAAQDANRGAEAARSGNEAS